MTRTITRMFDSRAEAEAAVADLEAIGVDRDDISIIAHGGRAAAGEGRSFLDKDADGDGRGDVAEGAGKGAATGGVIGGAAGLLAGIGALAIPGVGPVLAVGWLGSTLAGAVAGAAVGGATGGLLGALKDAGVDEKDAHVYAENVRRGGAIVSVKAKDEDAMSIEAALDQRSVSLGSRRQAYEQEGWTGFDESRSSIYPG
jgi:hypothetical protein